MVNENRSLSPLICSLILYTLMHTKTKHTPLYGVQPQHKTCQSCTRHVGRHDAFWTWNG